MDVTRAQDFIIDHTLQPAVDSPVTSERIKNLTKDSIRWIRQFRRTGDLIAYMDRFQGDAPPEIVKGLRNAGIPTFEDIHEEFLTLFGASQNDRTRLDDFVIGETYTPYDIHIFAGSYDLRSGGILPIGPFGSHTAVFIKATFDGGPYPNEWIEEGRRLRYYLKARTGKFEEGYQDNRSIIKFPNVPIYAFTRPSRGESFMLAGIFQSTGVHTESDGSKWFELIRKDPADAMASLTLQEFETSATRDIRRARRSSPEERRARLRNAPTAPKKTTVVVEAYVRNPDVAAEVLERAAGTCEGCRRSAPFIRRKDATPYLEVHHKTPLSLGGDDTVENAIALCPNCHRQEHYGPARWFVTDQDLPTEIEET